MDIQLNIQPNLVLAIIGALLFWQTMKLTYKHWNAKNFKNTILNGKLFKRDSFSSDYVEE